VWVATSHFPQSGVATLSPTKRKGQCLHWHLKISLRNYNCFLLDPWPSIADFYGRTLPQANLGVPKFPTLSWQVQGVVSKPFTFASSKDLIDEALIWEVIIPTFPSWGTQIKSTWPKLFDMTPFITLRLDHNNQALIERCDYQGTRSDIWVLQKPKSQATRLKYTNGVMTSRVGRHYQPTLWDAFKACACLRKLTLLASFFGAKFPRPWSRSPILIWAYAR
jgi:hypothetical protein